MEGPPTAGEQGEATFAEAAGRAQQGVVGLVVRGEALPSSGLLDRRLDALASAVIAGVGQGGQIELGAAQFSVAMTPVSRATVRSCRWPGATSDTAIGTPSGRMTAWTLPPGARCFPEYQALIVSPLTLSVVSAQRSVRISLP